MFSILILFLIFSVYIGKYSFSSDNSFKKAVMLQGVVPNQLKKQGWDLANYVNLQSCWIFKFTPFFPLFVLFLFSNGLLFDSFMFNSPYTLGQSVSFVPTWTQRGLGFGENILVTLLFLGVVAFYTLLERKGIAAVQRREGPNVTGIFGILQPVMDGVKLILKDVTSSDEADAEIYDSAPILTFGISFTGWALLPVSLDSGGFINSDYTIILFLCVASLGIFGIVGAGWATKSKYAILGGLRAISQFIAYEVYFSLLLIPFFLIVGADFMSVWERQASLPFVVPFLPLFIIFIITMLVETNRAPFDMPEAEAELVAGFNVEYSSSAFALFFLAEYNSMIIASTIMAILFWGGDFVWLLTLWGTFQYNWFVFYIIKIVLLCFSFVFIRANFPRVRFDQLLLLGWKVCLPLSLSFIWVIISVKNLII